MTVAAICSMGALLRVGYFEFTWPSDIKWVKYGNCGDKCFRAFSRNYNCTVQIRAI